MAEDDLAAEVVARCTAAGLSVAVAESLTAGQVCAAVVDVPGASQVLRGGVVAYATQLKASVLGVDADLLAARGPVDPEVARAMALGVRELMGADIGVATTGVAGPSPQGAAAVGTVFIAVTALREGHPQVEVEGRVPDRRGTVVVRRLALPGDRAAVRAGATTAALRLVLTVVFGEAREGGRPGGC